MIFDVVPGTSFVVLTLELILSARMNGPMNERTKLGRAISRTVAGEGGAGIDAVNEALDAARDAGESFGRVVSGETATGE